MSLSPTPPVKLPSPKSFCCQRANIDWPYRLKTTEQVVDKVDQILVKKILCPHDIDALLLAYRRIERIEWEVGADPKASSLAIIQKVQRRVKALLSIPSSSAGASDLINLYHLSQFPPIVPAETSIVTDAIRMRRAAGGEFSTKSIAQQFPYCISRDRFLGGLQKVTGLDRNNPSTESLVERPLRLLDLDRKLREKRSAFLEGPDANAYPSYLDQILERGFLYLYNYLLSVAGSEEQVDQRRKIADLDAFVFSSVVLDVRNAVVEQVERLVEGNRHDLVFLVGNTGSGKSTVFSLLMGASLRKKGDVYEVPGETIISHSPVSSCTFLPNVGFDQNNAYVDFPGFNDTRGEPIELGVELAFKALVSLHKPKIVIVESINALQSSRGGPVRELGQQLSRMLGPRAVEELCALFLTQYHRLVELARLEHSLEERKRLLGEIECLSQSVRQRKASITCIEQKAMSLGQENSGKAEKYVQEIQKLERELQELEKEKVQGLSEGLYARLHSSFTQELASKNVKLNRLMGRDADDQEGSPWQKEIEHERRKIEKESIKISKKQRQLLLHRESISQEEAALAEKTRVILELIGMEGGSHKVAELRYLEDHETLFVCKEVIGHARPVPCAYTPLSDLHRAELLSLFRCTFEGGGLPPFPGIGVDDLQRRALVTSLIDVLTTDHFPEIGRFLHLPEMEPECAETIDRYIVDGFADALIRLIVMGSLGQVSENSGDPNEDLVKNFITNSIGDIIETNKEEANRLAGKWSSLEERVGNISGIGAKSWRDLEQYYQSRFRSILAKLAEEKKRDLQEWEGWASKLFEMPFPLPKLAKIAKGFFTRRARRIRNEEMIVRVEGIIDDLNRSFDKIKELRRVIQERKTDRASALVRLENDEAHLP